MKKNIIFNTIYIFLALGLFSCMDDLNQEPIDPDTVTAKQVYKDAASAKMGLAKVYGALALTGQGSGGGGDIAGDDEGATGFSRILFCLQELPTDEAKNCWGDGDLNDYNFMKWTSTGGFNEATYNRIGIGIGIANDFIANATERLADNTEVKAYIAEARFIRAYLYAIGMDLYGKMPIVTEVGKDPKPKQATRAEIFAFVEKELLELETLLGDAKKEYGRVNKYAATALLSRIYLNAEVYTGTAKWAEAKAKAEEVVNGGQFALHPSYAELFMADNDTNGAQNEFIFVLAQSGQNKNYSGTTFLVHAAGGKDMNMETFGVNGGWYGNVTTGAFVDQFTEPNDTRKMFHTKDGSDERTKEITKQNGKISFGGNGYLITKWTNLTSAPRKLKANGDNLPVTAGTYNITIDVNNNTYKIERTDEAAVAPTTGAKDTWGIIGSATPDGWNSDVDMTDKGNGVWEIKNLALNEGEIKFRKGDDWAENLGKDKDAVGTAAPSVEPGNTTVSTDFPIIRLAELYLNMAEAAVKLGDNGAATNALNQLRKRAGLSPLKNADIETVFNERSRELYWECHRRTDLIRFGKFTTINYFWEYKGNQESATALSPDLRLYPIPNNVILANDNLTQNPGY